MAQLETRPEKTEAPNEPETQPYNKITISDDHSEGSAIKRRKLMAVASAEIDRDGPSVPGLRPGPLEEAEAPYNVPRGGSAQHYVGAPKRKCLEIEA